VGEFDRDGFLGWKKGLPWGHICLMANSIWTTEQFTCPSCGMNYTATREEHQEKRSGSFECRVCNTEVHTWSGFHDFFNWKAVNTTSPVFGKKK
jgi:predicted RNA-binding Zn-ribbon protein involved in translation (DUF1610 family)